MADLEKSLAFLNSLVQTDEEKEAFAAGYDLASDPENRARFSGSLASRRKDGLSVMLEDRDENAWTSERSLPRGSDTVLVFEPAFVLGSLCAALEKQWTPQGSDA